MRHEQRSWTREAVINTTGGEYWKHTKQGNSGGWNRQAMDMEQTVFNETGTSRRLY